MPFTELYAFAANSLFGQSAVVGDGRLQGTKEVHLRLQLPLQRADPTGVTLRVLGLFTAAF